MPELGKKYTCYSCHTKFYDLGKPESLCPKCGADQRDADDAPAFTPARSRRVVEVPVEDPEFGGENEPSSSAGEDDEEAIIGVDGAAEEEPDDEEEEEY